MDTQRTKISAFIYKLIGGAVGEEQGRRRGNSQRHATRARHTRALQSSIHVAILWRIFSSCSCRYFSRCIFHCHCICICICTCSCVSICACILHFSFNYVHLNPRPIRIFSHFCGLQRRGSATEKRNWETRPFNGNWLRDRDKSQRSLAAGSAAAAAAVFAFSHGARHPSSSLLSALPSPASFPVCLFSLASRQVDSTQLTCVRVCRTRSGECGVYLRCRATCHILGYLPQTVLPYPGH